LDLQGLSNSHLCPKSIQCNIQSPYFRYSNSENSVLSPPACKRSVLGALKPSEMLSRSCCLG
jgi:hypothetical protein